MSFGMFESQNLIGEAKEFKNNFNSCANLVKDDNIVLRKKRIILHLTQKQTFRQEQYPGSLRFGSLEPAGLRI